MERSINFETATVFFVSFREHLKKNFQVNTPIAMGGRNTRELTGHTQCHTSLLATSSLGDGPTNGGTCGPIGLGRYARHALG